MKIDWDKYVENANGSEDAHQISLMAWANDPETRREYPELEWLFHIPNGGSRHKVEAGKLKAMGVKPGVPDLFLPIPKRSWNGLFIELKNEKGKSSKEQLKWIDGLIDYGYCTLVSIGFKKAKEDIVWYLRG